MILSFISYFLLRYMLFEIDISLKYEEWNHELHSKRRQKIIYSIKIIKYVFSACFLATTFWVIKHLSKKEKK